MVENGDLEDIHSDQHALVSVPRGLVAKEADDAHQALVHEAAETSASCQSIAKPVQGLGRLGFSEDAKASG